MAPTESALRPPAFPLLWQVPDWPRESGCRPVRLYLRFTLSFRDVEDSQGRRPGRCPCAVHARYDVRRRPRRPV